MFQIHSVGDAAFLEQILMAVAMVTSTSSFEQMVAVGLLLGVLFVFIQSIMQGAERISLHQILLGYILYACFFVPTSRVVIEDSYTGQVRVVDNVPLGVAAAGGIISSIGYNLTFLFEQGYAVITPYVTDSQFAESLKILNDTRKRVASTPVYQAMNLSIGGDSDIRKSWNNYVRECTLTAVDLEQRSVDEIMAGELPDALRFDSNLYGTRLYLGPAGGVDYTCSEAYALLHRETDSAISSAPMSNAILNVLGVDNTFTGATGQSTITSSLGMLGLASTSGTKFLVAAVLEPIYYEAAQGRYSDFQDIASATMINQAIQQRNTQWAAEQSMFMTIVRPMMTFFEGFVYAITPLMGFLIVLGSFGASLAGRYFQTLLWIQLWLPVMSIINLYIHSAVSSEMASLGSDITSFYALNAASDQLQHWIATGGMLAAATPIISLFIVTGSTYAFTSLASRISGKDHIDEKIQSKDISQNGPVMQNAASNEYNDLTGMAATGAAGLMGQISFGSGISSMVSSSQQRMQQSQQAFSESLGSNFSSSTMDSQTYERAATLGRTHSAAHGTSEGLVNERAHQIMQNSSIGSQHSDAVRGIVSAVASGSISASVGTGLISQLAESAGVGTDAKQSSPLGGNQDARASQTTTASRQAKKTNSSTSKFGADIGLEGKLSATANKETVDTATSSFVNSAAIGDALKFSKAEQAQVTNSLAQAVSTGSKEALSDSFGSTDSQALTRSAQDVVSSAQSYTEASSLNQSAGSLNNLRLRDVGSMVSSDSAAMKHLNDYWNSGGVSSETKREANDLFQRYSAASSDGGYGLDQESALAASRIKALQNSDSHGISAEQFQRNFGAAVSAVGKAMNIATGGYGNFAEQSTLASVSNGDLHSKAQNNAQRVADNVAPAKNITVPSSAYPAYESPQSAKEGFAAINEQAARNSSSIREASTKEHDERYAGLEETARRDLISNGPDYDRMSSAELYGGIENASDWLGRRMSEAESRGQQIFSATSQGMSAASKSFSERMDELKSNESMRNEVINAAKMSDQELAESGLGGRVLSGLSSVGRSILGAAAAGIELARGEIGYSDLKNMSLEEKGMVYEAALAHAFETGGAAAVGELNRTAGVDFKQQFMNDAMSRGLTTEQAAVYASSFDAGGLGRLADPTAVGDTDFRTEAISNLAATYAERNDDGSVMVDSTGTPVLNESNQEFVDHMVNTLTESARAGSTLSGSYMAGIANYNTMTGRSSGSRALY